MLNNAIWITGAKGCIGSYLEVMLEKRGYEVLPTDVEVDVTDLEAVNEFAAKNRPVTVINCAALAGRTVSDADPTEAFRVNAIGARNVAIASGSIGAKIVHLSTDDVFPQNLRTAVDEFDVPSPDCVYGRSKLAGENFVRSHNREHVIVRSSWIYGLGERGVLERILETARQGGRQTQLTDQIGSPTSISTFANYVVALMEAGEFGTFHISCAGRCSRYEFAKQALELAGLPTSGLVSVMDMAHAYFIELDNLMLRLVNFEPVPSWRDDLRSYMSAHGLLSGQAAFGATAGVATGASDAAHAPSEEGR